MGWHIAQMNVARLRQPLDHPASAGFAEGVASINALAESSPGFVWRFKDEEHPEVVEAIRAADPLLLANLSVWESVEALKAFAYRTSHADYYRRRADWFEKHAAANGVLWWVRAGTIPAFSEAQEKLALYRKQGATADAFWFGHVFPAPPTLVD